MKNISELLKLSAYLVKQVSEQPVLPEDEAK